MCMFYLLFLCFVFFRCSDGANFFQTLLFCIFILRMFHVYRVVAVSLFLTQLFFVLMMALFYGYKVKNPTTTITTTIGCPGTRQKMTMAYFNTVLKCQHKFFHYCILHKIPAS